MPERRLKVAVIVPRFPTTSETFIVRKVTGLVGAGIDVAVLASEIRRAEVPHGADVRTLRAWRAAAIRRHPAACVGLAKQTVACFGASRRALRALSRALPFLAADCDIIHFEFSGVGLEFSDALDVLPEVPVVVSCRGAAEQIAPLVDRSRAASLAALFARVSAVHAVSSDMAATVEALGADPEKILVNRPAVDVEVHRRRSRYSIARPPVLLSVGRLHWKKGFDVALLAVRRLLDDGVMVRYEIIGAGVEHEKLAFMISELRLGEHVVLLGEKTPAEVRAALEGATLFLLSSLSEGISNAVLEAMAMEVPVISTTAGGMGEVIDDGVSGFLAPTHDAPALAARIREALSRASLGDVGRAARQRVVEEFSLDRQIRTFVQLYGSITGGERPLLT